METTQILKIKSYLSVCEDAPTFKIGTKTYKPGSKQEFSDVELKILDKDILSITIPGHVTMKVGGASKITALSIRYCGENGSIIPQYEDSMMNLVGCCICCNGWCIYGDHGCACG
jgi:hypothetical protein